jgi:hypothetical protein
MVPAPTAVLNALSVLLRSENKPTAVLYVPAVRLSSAFSPSAVFPRDNRGQALANRFRIW